MNTNQNQSMARLVALEIWNEKSVGYAPESAEELEDILWAIENSDMVRDMLKLLESVDN